MRNLNDAIQKINHRLRFHRHELCAGNGKAARRHGRAMRRIVHIAEPVWALAEQSAGRVLLECERDYVFPLF